MAGGKSVLVSTVSARMRLSLVLLLLLPLGCAEQQVQPVAATSATRALDDPQTSRLGRFLARITKGKTGSGFSLVESGPEALASIRSLIASAGSTLDLQYYIWKNDETGRLLLTELVGAARRGVRVRLLLDDMEIDWPDGELARLSAHPNFEARLYNPLSRTTGRLIDAAIDFGRVTHRMHNKVIIADNAIAVMGGRNIANAYFAADENASFRDLDVHAAGPVVRQLSRSFDAYWNSDWSKPVRTVEDDNPVLPDLRSILSAPKPDDDDDEQIVSVPELNRKVDPEAHIRSVLSRLIWTGDATVLADAPNKPMTDDSRVMKTLAEKLPTPERVLIIESAFFIPGKAGVDYLCARVKSGLQVRVLTNSLSSIDAITAYAGYRAYREDILRCGVELYELRPKGTTSLPEWSWYGSGTTSILHTKAAVIDGSHVFVGSLNFDPRSVFLNTEIALLIRSPDLATQVRRFMEEGMKLHNAYRLVLEDGDIVWITMENGKRVRLAAEPDISLLDRLVALFIGLLPIEKQL